MSKEGQTPPLTDAERKSILERDNYTSQMRHYSEEEGWHTGGYCEDETWQSCNDVHVHHIIPRGNGGTNNPENLITLFACEHVGVCKKGKIKTT